MSSFKRPPLFLIGIMLLISCNPSQEKKQNFDAYLDLSLEDRQKPENATGSFKTPDGLNVKLFASEPMVINPTNIDVDHRGRVWVCESPNYGVPMEEQVINGGRISILEDTDNDGKADKSTVFYEGEDVNIALGIAVLGNKIFVTRSPDILVFTDENGDDIPDKKEKLFTGLGPRGDHSAHAVVFGPDGKLYWNMGNGGGQVKDANGNAVIDQAGNPVIPYSKDYIGGMIFRCNLDGTAFETLGHNFRNNYEVAVDSYGNLWQSDNDDDGNKSCRINFILEYGNYGYLDEFSRESWHTHRTNIEGQIARQHWHQNDPGVVPNLLVTGAGSPSGIAVYEGSLFPETFRGEMIHADAGPNVVRAYPVTKEGAGYTAKIKNIVKSQYDQWFRPIDVTAAPDGSLFIGDWYDPGVGGGVAADAEKGRIFRVAPDIHSYRPSATDFSTIDGCIAALKNPNLAQRYLAWTTLHEKGEVAESALKKLLNEGDPVYKARALWLLGKIPGKEEAYIRLAIEDENPQIRILGIRLARQTEVDFIWVAEKLVNDPAPEVRREVSIGLHLITTPDAANIWADLALQHDGNDRWYLEALGIGAANNWDAAFNSWLKKAGDQWNSKGGKDIIWRARSKEAIPKLAQIIEDVDPDDYPRYFRAFDFHKDDSKQEILLSLLGNNPDMTTLALQHINPKKVGMPASLKKALDETLGRVEGTQEFLNLVKQYTITTRKEELLDLAMSKSGKEISVGAVRLLLEPKFKGKELISNAIRKNEDVGRALVSSLGKVGNRASLDLLSSLILDKEIHFDIRKDAVIGLGNSWTGEEVLLSCVKDPEFDEKLKPAAGSVLFNVYRTEIQNEAAEFIPRPGTAGGKSLPTIRNLIPASGKVSDGMIVFDTYCKTCHVVDDQGTAFGPNLSEIGSKLSKEGLYRAIIYPSEGINYDYEGVLLNLKDGSSVIGIAESETEDFIEMRLMGGVKNKYLKSDIQSKESYPQSLMTNLSGAMSEKQLIDLVEYLTSLKKGPA